MRCLPSHFRTLIGVICLGACGLAAAGELTVSAASSLTNAFKDVAQGFEKQNPGTKVLLNFGASGALLQQIAKGAPVDVLASADQDTMDQAEQLGLVLSSGRRNFVSNTLVLIQPVDAPQAFQGLKDLGQARVQRVAIGNPASVPVGRYTQRALEAARLWPVVQAKAVQTQNVRQSLDYVARGEVDAGFVYATDASVMKDKVKVAFSVPLKQAIQYPIAPLTNSAHSAEARRFVAYVLSAEGQATLARHGFLKP
ncbi:molybdate ABC transporter substrate-binding protein [Aquabacterium sp.]|uniref:molybdate ABC transporter substrate-binding protein n=1 Tax=Aquabacterium sp. TaxID=1872578 RepID=UPI002E3341C0|nr:molybdate ABC transporter substrate-binding protein [Aquabacterium sp.]HEX5311848.1 molybdate ABC transporter substrate-binding protein [Aquabacterium sp.]